MDIVWFGVEVPGEGAEGEGVEGVKSWRRAAEEIKGR